MINVAQATIIDLRSAEQREAQPLPEAQVIPLLLDDIEEGLAPLPAVGTYLVVCERGARAALAARYLRADGLNAEAWRGTLTELQAALADGSSSG